MLPTLERSRKSSLKKLILNWAEAGTDNGKMYIKQDKFLWIIYSVKIKQRFL